jgi:hypothetical protein
VGVQGIKYGRGHERLERLLRSIDRPGNYCVGGREFLPVPRVVVEGVGELSFPVPPVQVEALADAAERAPYGKGTRTLVDPSVRDCWQIDARDVSLSGRAWPGSLATIVELVAEGLGLPAERLGAELYKLLIYRRGGFFAEHRDTEKVPGMVATLSLSLPAAGAGGEIVVRHGNNETTYDMTANEPSELPFAAFYADCPHEVLPVTEGRRVSLVFNLFLDSAGRVPGAPDYSDLLAPVAECLAEWRAESVEQDSEEDANKIVWLLEHEYSEDGLSFATLKNTDAAVAGVLQEAAGRAGCEFLAAVLRIHEYGTPDFHMDYWGDVDEDESTMVEVHDRWEALDSWADTDGSRPNLGEIPLNAGELLPEGALDDAEPDDQRLEGSTGNEGPTLEHVYRRAALVVWPREKTVDVLARGGIDGAVAWAASRITGDGGADSNRDVEVIERLIELWPLGERDYRKQDRGAMLCLLASAGTAEQAVGFLHRAVKAKYDGSENEALAAVMPLIGAEEAGDFLLGLAEEQLPRRPSCVVELLVLAEEAGDQAEEGAERAMWRAALRQVVSFVLMGLRAALEREARVRADREANRLERIDIGLIRERKAPEWIDHEAVRDLFLLARPLDLADEAMAAAGAIGDRPRIVTRGRMLPAALEGMHEDAQLARSPAYALLWRQAADFLLERSSDVPAEPIDWAMPAEVRCDCEDCAALLAFCRDPAKRVGRFSVRKDRRKHLHRTIDGYGLDLDHVTERKGSPYTLVCTKTRDGHRRRLREYAEDLEWMDSLRDCAPRVKGAAVSAETVDRLARAVETGTAAG